MMADDVTLRECVRCREARNALGGLVVVISHRYKAPVYRVHCSKCGEDSPERLTRDEAVEAHNTRVPDPALAVKDARIKELEAQLNLVEHQEGNLCETCGQSLGPPWAAEKAHMMDHVAELEAELAAMKDKTCENCHWHDAHTPAKCGLVTVFEGLEYAPAGILGWHSCPEWEPCKDKEEA